MWRATDLLLERAVAVKVLRPEYSDHPETLDRFRKEARNAGALSNPHVAQVYDYGLSGPNGSPYLVMEYVDGPSLADILAVDPIDPVRALDVIAQAAEGLAAAHKAGVIHRDIKPGNILISSEGRVKVTDFGIAHAAGQAPVTGPGLVMGTTQYMAPERIAGNPGSAASDLYALGIVLHECLTGVPPHDGTAAEVMAAHLYLPLPPLPADVPPEFDHLVARLTAKDPAKRISDARELADLAARLRDALGGTLVPPGRTGGHSGSGAAVRGGVRGRVGAGHVGWQRPGPPGQPRRRQQAERSRQVPRRQHGTAGLRRERRQHGAGLRREHRGDALAKRSGRPRLRLGRVERASAHVAAHEAVSGSARSQPEQPRRRARTFAVGAAVVASAGLVALLVSGALNSPPAANQRPAGPSTTHPDPHPGPVAQRVGPARQGLRAAGSFPAGQRRARQVPRPSGPARRRRPAPRATRAPALPPARPLAAARQARRQAAPQAAPRPAASRPPRAARRAPPRAALPPLPRRPPPAC